MTKKEQKEMKKVKCDFCKKIISNNNDMEPLVCVCEGNDFFHLECYEKSGQEIIKQENIDINKIVKSFEKVRIKH